MVIIEYVPYGDLLGYLRKSRGLNDTYYKDPDIKPKTTLTSQQLIKFAWQVADGMAYLSTNKVGKNWKAARKNEKKAQYIMFASSRFLPCRPVLQGCFFLFTFSDYPPRPGC